MKKQFQSLTEKGRWLLTTLTLLFTLGITQMWAADFVKQDVSTTGTIIYSNINNTGSNVSLAAETEQNGFYALDYAVSFKKGPDVISVTQDKFFAICVEDITEGTVYHTMTVASNVPDWSSTSNGSDGRYIQLYVGNTAAKKYLYTKYSVNTTVDEETGITKEGTKIRGLYSFSFTSSDLTTIGTKKYLKFKALGGEYKPAGFKIVASATPAVDETAPTFVSSLPADGATDVAVEGTIVLTFSEEIASVDEDLFSLDGATLSSVAVDGTDATKVNVAYTGAANSATVTLSVVTGAVEDAAGNALEDDLDDIAFTTIASSGGGEDPEPPVVTCPTSGVVYSVSVKSSVSSNQSFPASATTEVSPTTQADITGGKMYGINGQTSAKNLIASSSGYKFCMTNNNTTFKLDLDCPIQAGDKITLDYLGGSKSGSYDVLGVWVATSNDRPGSAPACAATASSGSKTLTYIVTAGSIYENAEELYLHRATGGSTYFNNVVITRPYAITFSSAKGSAPSETTGFEVELEQITGVDGWVHTGWTANKVVKVSDADVAIGTAIAVDATATVSDNTQFTAVWEEEVVTYSVTYKANNGTEEEDVVHATESIFAANMFTAPEGKKFNGWNTKAEGDGTPYAAGAAVTAATTVYAQWIVDPTIRLIKNDGSLNTENFVTGATLKDDKSFTVNEIVYAKNVQFGNSCSGVTSIDNLNKAIIYHTTTDVTKVTIVAYNNYTSNSTSSFYYAVVPEGTTTVSAVTKTLNKSTGDEYEINMTGRSTLYIYTGQKEIRICQILVEENGEANKVAPAVGYSVNLNKGRAFFPAEETTFEGVTYRVTSQIKPVYAIPQIKNAGTDYVSFTIPTGQTRQLQLTTSNTAKYTVSQTKGDDANQFTPTANEAKNWNLTAGTWYINPQGSNVSITNIAFATAPSALTVTYKDGEDTYTTQNVWAGEKTTAPADPTKTGYRFIEWREAGESTAFDFANTTIDADLTLNAVWQKTWTVTFDSDGGSDVAVATVDDGQAIAQPANPTKTGFDFVEWQLSGSAYDFSSAVTANITLVATWEVAQTDASLSALSYNSVAIDVNSAEDVSGVQTYTVHLLWGSTIDASLISVTKSAESAEISSIVYNSENKQATFSVTSGNGTVTVNYAIQFVIDAKRGTSIIKAVTANNTVTGLIGGTRTTNLSNGDSRKLDKKTYFGMTLAGDETFQEGDVIIINITAPADLGKFMVYADAERTELVADQGIVYTKPEAAVPVLCPTGEMMMTLPAAADGKKSLYISREDGNTQWNVTFSSLEVLREMSPAIKSFKFGDDAATINEAAKTISIDVPYGTDVTALTPTVEVYGNNGATYTPSGETDFSSPVDYVVTDAYEELSTTYEVTVNVAAPSENADLASLEVAGYPFDFYADVTSYSVVLDYGTTVLPTITYEVADQVSPATAVKVEGSVNDATTITVTAQSGAEKVYTINFSVSTSPKYVIYDGSKMDDFVDSNSDLSTGFAWTVVGGSHSAKNTEITLNGKTYTKAQNIFGSPTASNTRYIEITIPEGYLAKFYLAGATNSKDDLRSSYISKEKTGTLDESIAYVSSDQYAGAAMRSNFQFPGTYYYCSDASIRLYELSIQLYPIDKERDMTQGRFGTICYPNGGYLVGAMLLEIAYFDPDQKKIFFDEVVDGKMVAGAPYLFLPNEGVDKFAITYTDELHAAAGHHNGLYGSYTQEPLPTDGNHYIMLNNQYCKVVAANTCVGANRAYIQLDKIGNDYVAPAYGRRRVSMGVQQTEIATGIESLNIGDQPMKIMIDGQIYILRGEKMYDATGRLVK